MFWYENVGAVDKNAWTLISMIWNEEQVDIVTSDTITTVFCLNMEPISN